ncbi:MAG: 4Fe-4S cluster-binding domain-containing protein, partial [Cyanobacteria bacterium REEB65]|nr:4Fe-4S cluster-binding domain-containing protein [Cyanobacteria bacterium REEB65]
MATTLERPRAAATRPAGRAKMPPGMTRKIAGYLLKNRLSSRSKFPMVLMLEPLHACNFHCTGCGRIREYEDTIREQLSLEQCLAAVAEADTPVVSICGGEPLIYRHIGPLVKELQRQDRYIYLCTNA